MNFQVTVTFEFENDAPLTRQSQITATSANTAVSRAIREARREWTRRKPTSIVCLVQMP